MTALASGVFRSARIGATVNDQRSAGFAFGRDTGRCRELCRPRLLCTLERANELNILSGDVCRDEQRDGGEKKTFEHALKTLKGENPLTVFDARSAAL